MPKLGLHIMAGNPLYYHVNKAKKSYPLYIAVESIKTFTGDVTSMDYLDLLVTLDNVMQNETEVITDKELLSSLLGLLTVIRKSKPKDIRIDALYNLFKGLDSLGLLFQSARASVTLKSLKKAPASKDLALTNTITLNDSSYNFTYVVRSWELLNLTDNGKQLSPEDSIKYSKELRTLSPYFSLNLLKTRTFYSSDYYVGLLQDRVSSHLINLVDIFNLVYAARFFFLEKPQYGTMENYLKDDYHLRATSGIVEGLTIVWGLIDTLSLSSSPVDNIPYMTGKEALFQESARLSQSAKDIVVIYDLVNMLRGLPGVTKDIEDMLVCLNLPQGGSIQDWAFKVSTCLDSIQDLSKNIEELTTGVNTLITEGTGSQDLGDIVSLIETSMDYNADNMVRLLDKVDALETYISQNFFEKIFSEILSILQEILEALDKAKCLLAKAKCHISYLSSIKDLITDLPNLVNSFEPLDYLTGEVSLSGDLGILTLNQDLLKGGLSGLLNSVPASLRGQLESAARTTIDGLAVTGIKSEIEGLVSEIETDLRSLLKPSSVCKFRPNIVAKRVNLNLRYHLDLPNVELNSRKGCK